MFYERQVGHKKSVNKELYEIKDRQFLEKCAKDYRLNYSFDCKKNNKMTTPLIFGTLINNDV